MLDIPLWNFDDQGAKRIEPLHLDAGDTLRVTCHHTQELRDLLPAFDGTQEKYIVWGEGTTDEMCLGILQVVFDDGAETRQPYAVLKRCKQCLVGPEVMSASAP